MKYKIMRVGDEEAWGEVSADSAEEAVREWAADTDDGWMSELGRYVEVIVASEAGEAWRGKVRGEMTIEYYADLVGIEPEEA